MMVLYWRGVVRGGGSSGHTLGHPLYSNGSRNWIIEVENIPLLDPFRTATYTGDEPSQPVDAEKLA